MASKVTVKKVSGKKIKSRFVKLVKEKEYEANSKVKDKIEKESLKELGKTLKFKDQSGTNFFKDSNVSVINNIDEVRNDVKRHVVRYNICVTDSSGNPHKNWHIISFGRKGGVVNFKKRAVFKLRKSLRTEPNTLKVTDFKGYKQEWRSFKEGDPVPEIKARNWYTVFKDKNLSKVFKLKYFTKYFEVKNIKIRKKV